MPRKRIFIGLFLVILALLLFVSFYFYYSIKKPDLNVIRYSYAAAAFLLTFISFFALLTIGYILISVLRGIYLPFFNRLAERSVVFLFPTILQLGKLLRITQDKIQRSFIEVNNRLVECRNIQVEEHELLVLLPHCLQNSDCIYKVTGDPDNCHHCGRCLIDPILNLLKEKQVNVRIVSGGTLARKAVQTFKPKCILAVACERDLSSGIIDSFPIPVWGLLNIRPFGPCFNTSVSIEDLTKMLEKIIKPAGQDKILTVDGGIKLPSSPVSSSLN